MPQVVIIGAGIVGLGAAWRLAQAGVAVAVFDKGQAGSGASYAAAGMLGGCAEVEPGEEMLTRLGRHSQLLWPGFASELLEASGVDVNLRTEGTLMPAITADDRARLQHHIHLQKALDLPVEWLTAVDARQREPYLTPSLQGALWVPDDHQVDNRKLALALKIAAERAGAVLREETEVASLLLSDGRVCGVRLRDGEEIRGDTVVLAAGAWSRLIEGLPKDERPPVRPIKGQMLALGMDPEAPLVRHVIRGAGIYLVPRVDGRLIVGATTEEKGFDGRLTAGGMLALLEAAWRLIPGIEELPLGESWVGHRPGSRDDAPILGRGPVEGLVYATGHHRNGVLLAPVTADAVRDIVLDRPVGNLISAFGFERFRSRTAA
ncbi:glycine oxidase ThiO [Agaricicola taiwanensis]|uniref:Glycine oxidase ThiO n=1 Tax=Agaricicola taiwanensis TaxID=591372 RepID=A0A8J2YI66_9RHOB|nr:glycine oxidase ThiO [Agaricicola taiwanensis]GGE44611.1 glycine oxidase ThiO [Agaricicola taiwanensis]